MADKVLKVCLARDLPNYTDRLPNYIYFTYDNLSLYFGSNDPIEQNFAIVDEMPSHPVEHLLYILTTDGSLHQCLDSTDTLIAEIEDPSQIDDIRKAGTTFFVNGDSKYIDKTMRSLVLPFNNQQYEMVVDTFEEDQYDNDTIIKYNEDSGRFELYGGTNQDYIDYDHKIKGKKTASIDTKVAGSRIFANVNVSSTFDNALRALSDGLYVRSGDKVDKQEFEKFAKDFRDFKSYAFALLDNLEAQLDYVESIISPESIQNEIMIQLRDEYPTLDQAIRNYDTVLARLNQLETDAMGYTVSTIAEGIDEINSGLARATQWADDPDDVEQYTHEVNYYEKRKAWDAGELKPTDIVVIISTAIEYYEKLKQIDNDRVVIATALNKYMEIMAKEMEKLAAVTTVAIDKYEQLVAPDRVAVSIAIDKYEQLVAPERIVIATALNKYMEIKEEEYRRAAIATAINAFEEFKAIDEERVIIATALNKYIEIKQEEIVTEQVVIGTAINKYMEIQDEQLAQERAAIALAISVYDSIVSVEKVAIATALNTYMELNNV